MDIETVKNTYADRLMSLANVTGVGIGKKHGKPVIKVFVIQKVPVTELPAQDVIPRVIDGFDVDVEETGRVTLQS